MDAVVLVGAEQVERAAQTIKHAAEAMQAAANQMQWTLEVERQAREDWLSRLVQGLKED